ncbi:MAG: hypothetical protein Q9168_005821 [Polycauliona sp. 1 TL-2023]
MHDLHEGRPSLSYATYPYDNTPSDAPMANLTSLIYHKFKGLQTHQSATPTPKMPSHTNTTALSTSLRSGHPVYTSKNPHALPALNSANVISTNPYPHIQISPNGTWRSLPHKHTIPAIERLDLTGRFSYTAANDAAPLRHRPKNALKKGLRPTKSWELPRASEKVDGGAATRGIYRRRSTSDLGEEGDEDEEGIYSEPSPCKSRLIAGKLATEVSGKGDVMPRSTDVESSTLMTRKRKVVEILSDEESEDDDRTLYDGSPARPAKVSRLMDKASRPEISSAAPREEGSVKQTTTTNSSLDPKGPSPGTFVHEAVAITTLTTDPNIHPNHDLNHNNQTNHQINGINTLTPPLSPSSSTINTILRI